MKVLIKKELLGWKPNTIIDVKETDNVAMAYWIRRCEDAKIDGCCEILKESQILKNTKSENMIQSKEKKTNKFTVK